MADTFFDRIHKHSSHTPDVLACLANLSNDEVFTPPEVVNRMLDTLPQELFKSKETTFLDPGCKTGVFLREIAKRLLAAQMPLYQDRASLIQEKKKLNIPLSYDDEAFLAELQKTVDHICHNQLFGIAITELTSLLSRRSLYCSKYPNGHYSISKFNNAEGNIRFRRVEHTWQGNRCIHCGMNKSGVFGEDRKKDLETHAYEWIHTLKPEEIFNMKFDVIISNPPYQLTDGGNGASAMPIYQKFVEKAKKLNPRYISMIIPARWYAGGKGLDDFRRDMLSDKHLSHVVDYVNAKDCFPGTSIGGGVCYFLWDKSHDGLCSYTNIHDGKSSVSLRQLDEYPVFVRYNEAISIIKKVLDKKEDCFADYLYSRNPFGFSSAARGSQDEMECTLHSSAGTGYVTFSEVKNNREIVPKYKIMISKVTAEHANEPDKSGKFGVLSTTKVLKPNEVCTDSYLIAFVSNDEATATNCATYMCTKFFRFLLMQAVSSINLSREKFQFVPTQDFSKPWTDDELYEKYGLTNEEIDFIESVIKEKTLQ